VLPKGAEVLGKVLDAKSQGHFKGGAVLSLALESATINGDAYDIKTSSVSRYLKSKGKRSAAMIGGGAGGGASPALLWVRAPEPQVRRTQATRKSSYLPSPRSASNFALTVKM
jgi:hypothetical protein